MGSIAHRGARFVQKIYIFLTKKLDSGGKAWILDEKHGFCWKKQGLSWKSVDSAGTNFDSGGKQGFCRKNLDSAGKK